MAVRRIVANLAAPDPAALRAFYLQVFELEVVMDLGWVVTLAAPGEGAPQLSLAAQGGGGAALPAVTMEVEDLDAVLRRAAGLGVRPEHGPVIEPWGVRRALLRDPAGHLLNVMVHAAP